MAKQRSLQALVLALLAVFLSPVMLIAQTNSTALTGAAKGEGVRAATVLTIHGKVTDVNKPEKLVTVQVPNGQKYTLKVDNPYNLAAATVGTGVLVRYYEVVSVRKKNPGESLPSLSVNGGLLTAKPGAAPGAVAEEHLKAVVSVAEVDTADGTVTIRGADGSVETVKANDPKKLSNLKAGDELVIAISRATAISLQKEPAS
jgi:hypothetical protein